MFSNKDDWEIQENHFRSNIYDFIEDNKPKFLGIAVVDLYHFCSFSLEKGTVWHEEHIAEELSPFLEDRLEGREKGCFPITYASFPFSQTFDEDYPYVPQYPRVFLVADTQLKIKRQTSIFVSTMKEFPDRKIFRRWIGRKKHDTELIDSVKRCSDSPVGERLFTFRLYPQPMPIANITYMLRYLPPLIKKKS